MSASVEDIEFVVDDHLVRGRFHRAGSERPAPVVVAAHGWGMTADGDLQDVASTFAESGLSVLTFDFRHLGRSDGEPRQDLDPWRQIEDYRQAITYVSTRSDVDSTRIGVWGTSYSGGHVLVVAAIDKRVQCVVSQVPTIDGWTAARIKSTPAALAVMQARFVEDREGRMRGEAPLTIATVDGESLDAAYPGRSSYEYMTGDARRSSTWQNFTTLRSIERARTYNPGSFIQRIAPTPLLMIMADSDELGIADLQQRAYSSALEPKRQLLVRGGHYSVYDDHFDTGVQAAARWFERYLS